MKQKTKKSISLLGYIFSYGFLLLSIFTFVCAFINPSKTVTVSVNSFGEQYLDIICFAFAVIVASLGLHFAIKEYKGFKKELVKRNKK
ncbi:unnamed protein product [marine sediment metagenome]|uniref:Uncharacterized protein n=1 Tax=marine sediment metagenome TaxID=412755 RepID=X1APD4_9ZZZZ